MMEMVFIDIILQNIRKENNMDIVVVSNFSGDFSGNYNGRFTYLTKMLLENNDVEIITSSFNHGTKKQKDSTSTCGPCKITLIHEPGYKKNVDIQRLKSHRILGKNLRKYLATRKKPDVIYCAVPSLDFAEAAMCYAKEKNIPFIVDIQDLWPEAFKMVFNIPIISNLIFAPMERQANRIYSNAGHIVAVSQTYANRGLKVNSRAKSTVVYLGTEKETFDKYVEALNEKSNYKELAADFLVKDERIRIGYVGSLGYSYDLSSVFEAMRKLDSDLLNKIQFVVIGDGSKREQFEKEAYGLPVVFTGRMPYSDMVWFLAHCDIAVNPIHSGSAGSIINKVGDYAMAGLPVINTQECEEYRNLLVEYQAGINCKCESSTEIAEAIEKLVLNSDLRKKMALNSRKIGEEYFDRKNTYRKLVDIIMENQPQNS